MITLPNGFKFEYVAASGALAFDGKGWWWEWPLVWLNRMQPKLFTIIAKTTTYLPRKGNLRWWCPWKCVRLIADGTVNAVGLTNPEFNWWAQTIGPKIRRNQISIVASIFQEENMAYMKRMAKTLNEFDLVGVELNASCPNVANHSDRQYQENRMIEACSILREQCRHPLFIKLSVVHCPELVVELARFADVFDINSVPWAVAFPNVASPLAKLGGGGVSGNAAQPHTWRYLSSLKAHTAVPVIGPSVWEYRDIAKLRELGADAISFGAIHIPHPTRPTKFVLRDMAERGK